MDFRQPDRSRVERNSIVARQRDLETPAKRSPVDGGNDRFLTRFDSGDDVGQERFDRRFAEFFNVGAGNEGSPGTGNNDRFASVISIDLNDCSQQAIANRLRQRIYGGVIDNDYGHIAMSFNTDRAHSVIP
jgi:hypothetical protein